ncbi:MAG: hypothetical protein H7X94_08470, partial [Vallitaleaceae bacterium]|nr:hypothetical protein [Vallitaleaceae bacterium]
MAFKLPNYVAPQFEQTCFLEAPDVKMKSVEIAGTAPTGYHAMSIYPEYFKINGSWILATESRMDCVPVYRDQSVQVIEFRNLKIGDLVILGRSEDGSEGILVHPKGFFDPTNPDKEAFAFRTGRSRETAYSKDYDDLYELLRYEKANGGHIVWVLGPAVSFDFDARNAVSSLIEKGYINALLAG